MNMTVTVCMFDKQGQQVLMSFILFSYLLDIIIFSLLCVHHMLN